MFHASKSYTDFLFFPLSFHTNLNHLTGAFILKICIITDWKKKLTDSLSIFIQPSLIVRLESPYRASYYLRKTIWKRQLGRALPQQRWRCNWPAQPYDIRHRACRRVDRQPNSCRASQLTCPDAYGIGLHSNCNVPKSQNARKKL